MNWEDLHKKCYNRLLKLHYDAGGGHLGGNISCLDILLYLFHYQIKSDDVFIMSKGHSAGALYVTLWSLGKISEEELSTFHQNGTKLCAHATAQYNVFSTGSLGHGLSLATGIAKAKLLRNEPGVVYCLLSDGEMEEGGCAEAMNFSYYNKIKNLIIMVDSNGWKGMGKATPFSVSVSQMADGHDEKQIKKALESDYNALWFTTIKGRGTPLSDTLESHYLSLTKEQYESSLI